MIVPRTRLADQDLFELWNYIAHDNLDAADGFLEKLESIFCTIFESPKIGRSRSKDLLIPGLRSFPTGNYVILYYPNEEGGGVIIARVFNAARDIEPLLDE